MRILAIIPARGGSKGIPRKNLVKVLGKPLIDWSIEAAIQSKFVTDVVVTSDDVKILENSKKYKSVICLERPIELAQDDSPTEPVLLHTLQELKKVGKEYDHLILLQPTSPLRNAEDIDQAFKVITSSEATSLISVNEPPHHPLKSFIIEKEGYLKGLVNNDFPFMPRQSLPKVYQPNGAIYIIKVSTFLKGKKIFTDKTVPFLMTLDKSIDIDSENDIMLINKKYKNIEG